MKRVSPFMTARSQRGMSLITSLLFMVAALILGVSVMSINVMQERMIGNTKDHELAMQAAEAALRDAELDISNNIRASTAFTSTCTLGLCTAPSQRGAPSPLPVHDQAGFSWSSVGNVRTYGQYTAVVAFPKVAAAPVYVIEKLGNMGVPVGESEIDPASTRGVAYRITARATGARSDTIVMLQSIYSTR